MLRFVTALIFSLLFVPVGPASAQIPQGLVGTWVHNLAKSTYIPGPPPKTGSTRNIDLALDGMILMRIRLDEPTPEGNQHSHYFIRFDGKEYPELVRGSAEPYRLITLKPIDAYTLALASFHPGTKKPNNTGTWTLSKDNKTLTMNYKRTSPEGKPTQTIRVYDKQ